jgi:hypothetical protein
VAVFAEINEKTKKENWGQPHTFKNSFAEAMEDGESAAGQPQPNFHHEGREDHEEELPR